MPKDFLTLSSLRALDGRPCSSCQTCIDAAGDIAALGKGWRADKPHSKHEIKATGHCLFIIKLIYYCSHKLHLQNGL